MRRSQKLKWELIRTRGKLRYIFVNGLLGWGVPTAILFTIMTSLFETKSLSFDQEIVKTFIISIIIFPIGGVFWGVWTWSWIVKKLSNEQKY